MKKIKIYNKIQYIILILLLGIYVLSPSFALAQWPSQLSNQPFAPFANFQKATTYPSIANIIAQNDSHILNPFLKIEMKDEKKSYEATDIIKLKQPDGSTITMSYQDIGDEFEEFIEEKVGLGLVEVEEIVEDGEVIRIVRYAFDPDSADRLALQLEQFKEEMEFVRQKESEMNLSNIQKLNFREYKQYLHKNVLPLFKPEKDLPKDPYVPGNNTFSGLNTQKPVIDIQKPGTLNFGSPKNTPFNLQQLPTFRNEAGAINSFPQLPSFNKGIGNIGNTAASLSGINRGMNNINTSPQLPAFDRVVGNISTSLQEYPFRSKINSKNEYNTYFPQPINYPSREENIAKNVPIIQPSKSLRELLGIEFYTNSEDQGTLWDDAIPYNPCDEECDDGFASKDIYHNAWGDDVANLSLYIFGGLQLMTKYRTIEGKLNTDIDFLGISMSPLHASAYFESSDIPNVNIELESFGNTIYSTTSTGLSHDFKKDIHYSPEPVVIPIWLFSINLSATIGGQVGIELGYDVNSEIIEGVIEPYINAYGNLSASVDFILAGIGVSGNLTFIEDSLPIVASIEKRETNLLDGPLWCPDRDLIECAFSIRNELEMVL